MSRITVLGSSSHGNGYLFEHGEDLLIVEAGLSFKNVVLPAINWEANRVGGCLVSHRHGDHSKYVNEYIERRVKVYGNPDIDSVVPLYTNKKYLIGNFKVQCLAASHDVPCYSYIIDLPDDIRVLFITDTSNFNYKIRGVNCLMVEANYSEEIILERAVRDEWSSSASHNHLSIEKSVEVIKRHFSGMLQDVVLLHLSDGNSDKNMFYNMVKKELGIGCLIADKGLSLELRKEEF